LGLLFLVVAVQCRVFASWIFSFCGDDDDVVHVVHVVDVHVDEGKK